MTPLLKPLFEEFSKLLPAVSAVEIEKYERHLALLKSWNERMSLVSPNSLETAFGTHYADSIWISEICQTWAADLELHDVGTGAGFPGVVFALRYPDTAISLYEKSLKKQMFLSAAVGQLVLTNASVMGALPEKKQNGLFVSRAVFPRENFFSFYKSKLTPNSKVIACLGGKSESFSPPADFRKLDSREYTLPQDRGTRRCELFEFVPRET